MAMYSLCGCWCHLRLLKFLDYITLHITIKVSNLTLSNNNNNVYRVQQLIQLTLVYRHRASLLCHPATWTGVVLSVVHDFDYDFSFCHVHDLTDDHDSSSYTEQNHKYTHTAHLTLHLNLFHRCAPSQNRPKHFTSHKSFSDKRRDDGEGRGVCNSMMQIILLLDAFLVTNKC